MSTASKHFGLKLIALTLVVTIFATLLPARMVFRAEDGNVPQIEMPSTDPDILTEEPAVNNTIDALFEDDSLRTLNSKTLRLNDGTYTLGSYGFNVHFLTPDGFVEYDNTLIREGDSFTPTLSDIELAFGFDRPSYSISFDGVNARFELISDNLQPAEAQISELPKQEYNSRSAELFAVPNAKSQLSYYNILDGVTISYLIYGRDIKESIILDTLPEETVFRFTITTNSELFIDDDGSIRIGEAVIPHAFMYDAHGNASDAVDYSLEQTENGYILTITPDRTWLETSERRYPVVIDPTIRTTSPQPGQITDAYVKEGLPNYNTNYFSIMHVGNAENDPYLLKMRSYFRINTLPDLPKASRVISSTVSLQQSENNQWYSFASTSANYINVIASEVTSSWTDTQICWNNQPTFSDIVIDYSTVSSSTAQCYLDFDITSQMQKWYADSSTNYGIVLRSATENSDGFVTFISNDDIIFSQTDPSFYITYYDTKGLESRWAFAAEDAGTAGTVYVNLYNGKPVLVGPGLSTQDDILPLSVYPVYNGYLSGLRFAPSTTDINAPITANFNASAGYGFKLSCWESITYKSISGDNYYCYNDADGTELYFRDYGVLGILSEDGYDLTLTINSNSSNSRYVISDSSGNEKHFNSAGRIKYIKDEYGNEKSFIYDSNNRLTNITFKSKTMTAAETQLIFGYETVYDSQVNKYFTVLSQITNAKDSSIWMKFKYANSGNGSVSTTGYKYLRIIEYSNGDYAEYQYDDSNGALNYARQGNGSTQGTYFRLYYTNENVSRVRKYSSTGAYGNEVTFQYDHKKATMRTAGKDDIFGNSDDLLSVYLFDNYGNTVCSYLTDLSGQTVYGASSAEYTKLNVGSNPKSNNSVVKAGGKGQYSKNLISNGNLESTSSWTQTLSFVSCSASSTEHFFGTKSVYLSGSSSICSGTLSQNVAISEPGTYTLSAYVKSAMSMGYPTTINGAYIALDSTRSDILSGATDVNVQNGWRKLSVTKTFASAGTYTIELALRNMYGPVYFDGVSLIKGDTAATEFNYLSNSWIALGTLTPQTDGSVKLSCTPGNSSVGYTLINLNKPAANAAFTLSGWSMGYSVPEEDTSDYPTTMSYAHKNRFWGMAAIIYYNDGTSETSYISFNPAVSGEWQYTSGVVMPSKDNLTKTVTSVWIYLRYDFNANYAFFKDICFTETDASAYEYDENGNIKQARNTESVSTIDYVLDSNNISCITDSLGNSESYTYVTGKNKILTATDAQGITTTYGYNTNGLTASAVITPSSGSGQISSSAVYNNYGYLTSETDSLGHSTSYNYNTNRGLLNYVDNANNHRTQYVYDLGGKLTELYADNNKNGTRDTSEAGVTYTYDAKSYLTEINNGATAYHFVYDNHGNVTSVSIGSMTTPLVSYTYAGYNGKLLKTTYADGTEITNTYDNLDRVKTVSYNGVVAYTVTYDGNGNIDSYTDCATGRVYRYEYDALGREIRFFVTLNGTELYAAEKSYDSDGRSVGYKYTIGGIGSRTTSNTYDQYNRLSQETTAGGDTVSYTYDGFGRIVSKSAGNYTDYYEYVSNGTNTSTLIGKLTSKYLGITIKTVEYTYDNLGNILTEDDGVTYRQYTYDSLSQLQSEVYYDKTSGLGEGRMYFISKSGNVSYVSFEYNNGVYGSSHSSGQSYGSGTDWKELMTSFAGTPITYDANGNPLSYYNGQSYTFTWQKGRQLASAVTGTSIISYTYDVNGLRIGKTVNGTAHTYTYDGSLLLCDKWGSQYIEYFYDASGRPYALNYYNGSTSTKYFFVKNIEGDILELRSSTNALVAKYVYDGWGKLLEVRDSSGNAITSSTHIANLNVLRYRGYFYDTETKLYYLQSRYYDPQVQRFISPDVYVSTGQGIIGHNMFAYCLNNPSNKVDFGGNKPGDIFNTVDEAAIDAAKYLRELSWENTWEYSTAIYEVKVTVKTYKTVTKKHRFLCWTWTTTSTKTIRTKVTKYTYKAVKTDKKNYSVRIPYAPLFRKRVAALHTHPMGSWIGVTKFSNEDREWADGNKIPLYVHGPNGILLKYDPITKKETCISSDLPISPKRPWLD